MGSQKVDMIEHAHTCCCYFPAYPHPLNMYFKMVNFMLHIFYHNEKRKKICYYELSVNIQPLCFEFISFTLGRIELLHIAS